MGTISIAHTRWKPLCSISTYASEDFGKSDSYGLNFCTINIWDLKKRFRQRAMIHFNSFWSRRFSHSEKRIGQIKTKSKAWLF